MMCPRTWRRHARSADECQHECQRGGLGGRHVSRQERRVRPHRRRRGLGRLRDRPPPGGRGPPGRARRGGRPRLQPGHPQAEPLLGAVELARGLGVLDRAAAALAQDQPVLAARQGARRLERAERDDLHPRREVRLRRLGLQRRTRLVLPRRPAVLQEVGGLRGRPERVPRHRRPAPGHPHQGAEPGDARDDRGRRGDRRAAQRRPQRRRHPRRRPDAHDGARRPADVHLDRVHRAGRRQPAAHRHHQRPGQNPGLRRHRSCGGSPPVPARPCLRTPNGSG